MKKSSSFAVKISMHVVFAKGTMFAVKLSFQFTYGIGKLTLK